VNDEGLDDIIVGVTQDHSSMVEVFNGATDSLIDTLHIHSKGKAFVG
jgi:hypothetical protein